MTGVPPQDCPACGQACHLHIDFSGVPIATLPDRVMALGDVPCEVRCTACGHSRSATVAGLDVALETGRMEFGTLIYDETP